MTAYPNSCQWVLIPVRLGGRENSCCQFQNSPILGGIERRNFKIVYLSSMTTNSSLLGTETDPGYVPTSEEKTMAILSHVLCIVAWFLPPLIIYLVKKDESSYVAAHAKESLNFQITMCLAVIVLAITIIGLFLLWVVGLVATIFIIIATIKASENKLYRYPLTIRFIK